MSSLGLIAWLPLLLRLASAAGEQCVFPADWSGEWINMQRDGPATVIFNRDTVSPKGRCVFNRPSRGPSQPASDSYLLYKEERDERGLSVCYQCIVFIRRTSNILQYKEDSAEQMYCPDTPLAAELLFDRVCNGKLINEMLNTLIRETATPAACPFHGSYVFSFNRDWSDDSCGVAAQPGAVLLPDQQSRLVSCASESQQLWTFIKQPCDNDGVLAVDRKIVQCLAHWQDGDEWLYVKYDAEYRCIRVLRTQANLTLYVSGDNTCTGVFREETTQVTIRLSTTPAATARPNCSFPQWVIGKSWVDLTGQTHYVTSSNGSRLRLQKSLPLQRSSHHSPPPSATRGNNTLVQYTCQSATGNTYYTRIVQECETRCQCMIVRRLSTGVALMVRGPSETCVDRVACPQESSLAASYGSVRQLLFDSSQNNPRCPFLGAYKLVNDDSHEEFIYKVGCEQEAPASVVVQRRLCFGEGEHDCTSYSEVKLSCLASWTDEDGVKFVVIGKNIVGNDNVSGLCYAYRADEGSVRLTAHVACSDSLHPMAIDKKLPMAIDMQPLRSKGSCHALDDLHNELSSVLSKQTALGSRGVPSNTALLASAAGAMLHRYSAFGDISSLWL